MGNPLFNKFGPMNNMSGLIGQFQQFKQQFSGNNNSAREQVQQLLNSGQMTQEQFNQLSNMAQQFQGMMGGK